MRSAQQVEGWLTVFDVIVAPEGVTPVAYMELGTATLETQVRIPVAENVPLLVAELLSA